MKTFREWLEEKEAKKLNENIVKYTDLSKIKSDKDTYTDTHNIFIDKKNKRLLITTYYGDDEKILKYQEQLNKEFKKFKPQKALYMFDDKDNKYRNTLFEIE